MAKLITLSKHETIIMAKQTWRLYTYDVWGNEEDGYEVNDVFDTGLEYDFRLKPGFDYPSDRQISRALGLRPPAEMNGDDQVFYISYKGKPDCELRRIA